MCSNMDEPRDYHIKWRKSDTDIQIPYDITHMWNLKSNTNELQSRKRNRLTDKDNGLVVAKGVEGGMDGCLGLANASYYIRMGKPQVLHTV